MLWPPAAERRLRRMFALGRERTIEQDPAFALRSLVDIAIRALSPAVNDPTTAVQVLDYIEDLPLVIGRHDLHGHGEVVMGRPGPGRGPSAPLKQSFVASADRSLAVASDRQSIGGPRR